MDREFLSSFALTQTNIGLVFQGFGQCRHVEFAVAGSNRPVKLTRYVFRKFAVDTRIVSWLKNPDFTDYVGGRFKDGSGWNYKSVEREVSVADSSDIAWFDAVVYSQTSGRFRSTGVLIKQDDAWKIAHYAMSFLVFRENWQDVIELAKKTRAMKDAASVAE